MQQKIAEAVTAYNQGNYVVPSDITVQDWVTVWLQNKQRKISEQSYIHLESAFRNHLFPYIGTVKLQKLTRGQIEEAYGRAFFQKEGKNYSDKTYSHATVNSLSVQFKRCLQVAVMENVISKNPHNGVELHKLRPPKKVDAYSRADQEKIVSYTKNGDSRNYIFYLLISTGLRVGEACALTWDDVDPAEGKLLISKTAVSIHGSMIIQNRPKTRKGIRSVYLAEGTIGWLQKVHTELDADLNYMNLVVPTRNYTVRNPSNLLVYWKDVCKKLDIPYRGIHALRHTWATRALESGMDIKTVSDMLGHKNVITTMNIYQDALEEHKQNEIKKMENLF